MISRPSHRVLSLLLFFHRSGFRPCLSVPCMGRERSSGCCVILQSRSIGATPNFVPLCLCRTTAPTEHHLYLIVPVSGSHLVFAFSYHHHPSLCVQSRFPLALGFIVCAYYFSLSLTPSIVYIFYPTLVPSLCLYSPLCSPLILCYLTCVRSWNC